MATDEFDGPSYVATYRPRNEPRWHEVEAFVRRLAAFDAHRPFTSVHRLLRALMKLGLFCIDTGVPLDPERALHPDLVAHFLATGVPNGNTARAYRCDLRRVALRATRRTPWSPTQSFGRSPLPQPYHHEEIRRLQRCVEGQATERKRQAGRAFLALGLGAGLAGPAAAEVHRSDVIRSADEVHVFVRHNLPRTVPVTGVWANELEDLARTVETECLVGHLSTSPNRVQTLLQRIYIGDPELKLDPRRLRSTWMADRLLAGTPLPLLLEWAGVRSLRAFDHLMPWVAERLSGHDLTTGVR